MHFRRPSSIHEYRSACSHSPHECSRHSRAHCPLVPALHPCTCASVRPGELINALVLGDELLRPELLAEELPPEDQAAMSKEISKRIKA